MILIKFLGFALKIITKYSQSCFVDLFFDCLYHFLNSPNVLNVSTWLI